MRSTRRRVVGVAVLAGCLLVPALGNAESWEQRSGFSRVLYTTAAVAANVIPGLSAVYAPQCLPGYIVCKIAFAGISVLAAADQLALAGNGDMHQTRGILYRGFGGDWYLTGRHITGELTPRPLPDPPPPSSGGGGGWEPPPR